MRVMLLRLMKQLWKRAMWTFKSRNVGCLQTKATHLYMPHQMSLLVTAVGEDVGKLNVPFVSKMQILKSILDSRTLVFWQMVFSNLRGNTIIIIKLSSSYSLWKRGERRLCCICCRPQGKCTLGDGQNPTRWTALDKSSSKTGGILANLCSTWSTSTLVHKAMQCGSERAWWWQHMFCRTLCDGDTVACRFHFLVNENENGRKWLSQTPNPPRIPEYLEYSNENSQANHYRKTNNLRLRWPNRKNFLFCWYITTTNIKNTEILP